jgi:hypothetical protein
LFPRHRDKKKFPRKSAGEFPPTNYFHADFIRMKNRFARIAAVSALFCWLTLPAAFAQLPGSNGSPGLSTAMLKLFGNIPTFTAHADVQVLDAKQAERIRAPMSFAQADGNLRVEIDMSQMRGKDLPPSAVPALKQLGMDRIASVLRTDQKALFIVYPNARSYVNMPVSRDEASLQSLKLEKTPLGKEIVDKHPCVKNKVVVKSESNIIFSATTWNASDLKDFPLIIITKEKDMTSVMRFSQIQFARPDAKQFLPPAGFTKFTDAESLVLARSAKVKNGKK